MWALLHLHQTKLGPLHWALVWFLRRRKKVMMMMMMRRRRRRRLTLMLMLMLMVRAVVAAPSLFAPRRTRSKTERYEREGKK
jgi:hypothetical protein